MQTYKTFFGLVGLLFMALFALPTTSVNAINERINFQGKLVNLDGTNLSDGSYNIQFKIYQDGDGDPDTADETLEWTESRLNNNTQGVTVTDGIFRVSLGSVNAFGTSVDWDQDTLWLSVEIGNTNGTCTPFTNCSPDGEMDPMVRFTASPYALNSNQLDGRDSTEFVQLDPGASAQTVNTTNSVINIDQSGNGTILDLLGQGTGNIATLDTTNANASGVSIDVQANVSTEYALSVTGNNGSAQGLYVRSDGWVGVGTSSVEAQLHVETSAASDIGLLIEGATSQSGDYFRVVSSTGTEYFSIDGSGNIYFTQLTGCSGMDNSGALTTDGSGQVSCSPDDGGIGAGADTLQSAYDNDVAGDAQINTSDGKDILFNLSDSLTTDSDFRVLIADGSTSTASITRADGAGTVDPAQLLLLNNADTNRSLAAGLIISSAAGGINTAIDLTDADITNAIALGANTLQGTTAVIDFTNFDVDASGNITTAGTLAVNGDQITADGATLTINADGAVDIQDNLTADSLTTDTGGIDTAGDITLQNDETISNSTDGTVDITTPITALSGNLQVNGGDIGIAADTDLIQLASGELTVNGNGTLTGDLAVNGGDLTSTGALNITPGGALTVGSATQTALLQGSTATITSTGAGNDITLTSADQIILNAAGTIELQDNTNIAGNSTGDALTVSNSTSTGNIAVFNDNATVVATIADGGAVTFNNTSDSAAAFVVQNVADNVVFGVDTSAGQVVLGTASTLGGRLVVHGGTSGNVAIDVAASVTSWTLTLPSAVGADGECLKASGSGGDTVWGSCGAAASNTTISFVPEYQGVVLVADGSNNNGTLTAGHVDSLSAGQGYKHNYYEWTTSQSTAQDYDLKIVHQLPSDFSSFNTGTLDLWAYANVLTDADTTLQINDADGTACYGAAESAKPASANTWEQNTFTDPDAGSCTFSANDFITFIIKVEGSTTSNQVRVGELTYEYTPQ